MVTCHTRNKRLTWGFCELDDGVHTEFEKFKLSRPRGEFKPSKSLTEVVSPAIERKKPSQNRPNYSKIKRKTETKSVPVKIFNARRPFVKIQWRTVCCQAQAGKAAIIFCPHSSNCQQHSNSSELVYLSFFVTFANIWFLNCYKNLPSLFQRKSSCSNKELME